MGRTLLRIEQFDVTAATPGGPRLIRGFELALQRGEVVNLRGPSGCGKTTLLRAVAGLIDAAGGSVTLDDAEPARIGWPTFRRQVVYVAQRPVMLDESVRDNLRRPFHYATTTHGYDDAAALRLLEQLGLDRARMDQPARSLSEGQQQRVALARALLLRPRVLLLDEPTSALDDDARDAAERVVRDYVTDADAGVLVASHDTARAERWCDRVIDLTPVLAARPGGGGEGEARDA